MASPDTKRQINNTAAYFSNAGDSLTFYTGVGSSNGVSRYLNAGTVGPVKLQVLPFSDVLLTEVDGRVLDWPLKLHAAKGMTLRKIFVAFSSFKIYALSSATTVEIRCFDGGG